MPINICLQYINIMSINKLLIPVIFDVFIRWPFKKAPFCLFAEKNCIIKGL